jgi:AraC-like DNA-binding protein
LTRPRDLGDAVEIAIASPASRSFLPRQSSTLGICVKAGPTHAVSADGRALDFPADGVCVRAPGCIWSTDDTGPTGFVSIDVAIDAAMEGPRRGGMTFVDASALPDVRATARVLQSAGSRLAKQEAISLLVAAVVERALVRWPEVERGGHRTVLLARARAFLDDAVADNPSLDEVAAAAQLNKHVLVRRFRELYGTTPHAYLVIAKVDRARELLARGVAAAEVAMRLGFADQPHLTRRFRSVIGLTPVAYQRRVRAVGGGR